MMASRLANRIAILIARLSLAALLAAAGPAVHAQAFRCQYEDGHIEYSQSTCPFGTKALNVARPDLKQTAARASAPAAPAPKASPAQVGQRDDPGPDGQAPITWSMVDIDYKGG